jgi:REP element-mobilizing transposase RayT
MENDRPKRKSTHLQYFDYASKGAYFITICTQNRKPLLSEIFLPSSQIYRQTKCQPVGEGLAPPAPFPTFIPDDAVAEIRLKSCGQIVKEQLLLLENRYPTVSISDYVIMPDHIHAIIFLNNEKSEENNLSNTGGASPSPTSNDIKSNPPDTGGASPSPTLNDVICSFKSLTARACKQKYGVEKMFQRSYAEHIIRDYSDYETRKEYIQKNPIRWYCKQLSKQDE